jgi:hypothetical protein
MGRKQERMCKGNMKTGKIASAGIGKDVQRVQEKRLEQARMRKMTNERMNVK